MLKVENLHISYGFIEAVKGIDFEVNDGEIVALIGANGAGKTTTVKLMNRLEVPTKGDVFVGDKNTKDFTTAQISRDRKSVV